MILFKDGFRRVRCRRKEKPDIRFAVAGHVHLTIKVLVSAAISYSGRSPLLFIGDNLIAARYIEDVLQLTLLFYRDGHPHTQFQRDNARPILLLELKTFLFNQI